MAGRIYYSPARARQLARPPVHGAQLTVREPEPLQIARASALSVRTAETHRLPIKRKLGIEGQAELIKYAVGHAHFDGAAR